MLTVSELFIYPIKSLGGISVNQATVTDRGFMHDRRWMLVDDNNVFISQRDYAQMALLQVDIDAGGLRVTHKLNKQSIVIPFTPQTPESCDAVVWNDTCQAVYVSNDADKWFSDTLNVRCRLVYMPDESHRTVNPKYSAGGELTSFADAYPFLLIGQASLDDLNSRLTEKLPMNRFRPNIVFTGGDAYVEDVLKKFTINGITFKGVKLCERCVVTATSQETALRSKEPLKTLAKYRLRNKNVMFGQDLVHKGTGLIKVGDVFSNISLHENNDRFIV
ncbi:MOSC domain-containing protein [Mucilaginibacter hurinus]|uniref:MOSC domain-containing protein n=2 Tax=Mucilaginibacter hurinus TaxID=2201324 RepID=A0A367GS53_9SPHI|nr:MOSC domain-containing protein [Mucilaginibacter hurinus]